jgi:hypothetical protein
MSAKPTLTTQVADLSAQVAALVGIVTPLVQGQFATATAVAEATVPAQAKPVEVKVAPVKTASDLLLDAVTAKGLAFARGGRTVLTTEHLTAAVRVLKTGTPEILPVKNTRLEKRNVTHIAIGRDGTSGRVVV